MSTEALSLFPVPTLPALALPRVVTATTAAILCHHELSAALQSGGWTEEAVLEFAELIAASRAVSERLKAMLLLPGGKR